MIKENKNIREPDKVQGQRERGIKNIYRSWRELSCNMKFNEMSAKKVGWNFGLSTNRTWSIYR